MRLRNWRPYFSRPPQARGNADGIGVSRGSPGGPRRAIAAQNGNKKHGTERSTAEKTADDSPSVRGRQRPRRDEDRARYVYLIKRADGLIKVGISGNVSRRKSQLAQASPEKLSVLKIIKPSGGGGLAFHIESAVKFLLWSLRVRGEWFKCADALALLALRAAELGELDCRALIKAEIKRQRLLKSDDEHGIWEAHLAEMCLRWPGHMHEVDPWNYSRFSNGIWPSAPLEAIRHKQRLRLDRRERAP